MQPNEIASAVNLTVHKKVFAERGYDAYIKECNATNTTPLIDSSGRVLK